MAIDEQIDIFFAGKRCSEANITFPMAVGDVSFMQNIEKPSDGLPLYFFRLL